MAKQTSPQAMQSKSNPAEAGRNRPKGGAKKFPRRASAAQVQAGDLLEHISDGFVAFDAQMNYTYVNIRGAELLGRKPEDLVGKNYWKEFPEVKRTRFAKACKRALKVKKPIVIEEYYQPSDHWFESRIYPSKDGLTVFFSEITERKRAELALSASQAMLEEAQRIAHVGSWEWIEETDRPTWSRELCAILEVDPDQPVPCMAEQDKLYTPDSMVRMRTSVEKTMRTGEPYEIELERVREDGSRRWLLARGERWYDQSGRLIGLRGTALDITERKQAEEELRLSRDRLADLSRRLVLAHETESRAIGRELHDQIGQMLTALKLTVEIAVQLPPEHALQKIRQGQELVNDLMSRVSALSLELRPPMLDDLGLLPALLWHVNRIEETSGIPVDFKHSGVEGRRFSPEIETTTYRLVQEALTNIVRHASATRASLEVRAECDVMEIQVGDNGVGFDPQSALAKNRGLGGMRERVNLLGGSFRIESKIGQSTKEFIQLPLREDAA